MLPQPFISYTDNRVCSILAKIIEHLLLAGPPEIIYPLIKRINYGFHLGTVAHVPGNLRYFGLNILKQEYMTITDDGDDKLQDISTVPIYRFRRRKIYTLSSRLRLVHFCLLTAPSSGLALLHRPFVLNFLSAYSNNIRHLPYRNFLRNLPVFTHFSLW